MFTHLKLQDTTSSRWKINDQEVSLFIYTGMKSWLVYQTVFLLRQLLMIVNTAWKFQINAKAQYLSFIYNNSGARNALQHWGDDIM